MPYSNLHYISALASSRFLSLLTPAMSLHSTRPARTISSPFREVWALTDRPLGILTCTSISPSGVWLVSASQDGSVLFLDYKAGILVGILDLESRFYVTAAVWRSDTTLTLGCSNGIVYQLDFEHKVSYIVP
jgi:WD40 repeat protein